VIELLGFLKNILGNENEKEIKKLAKTVQLINEMEGQMKQLTDEEMASRTQVFRQLLADGKLWKIFCQKLLP
jgi:preprotein translocase subunit SecA